MIWGNFAVKILTCKTRGRQSKKTKQKLEESCLQVVFTIWFPWNSRRFDKLVACELRDEFCACMIENWTVVCRGYFSHAISYRENVASANGNRSSCPKVISPEVMSPGTRVMLLEIHSHVTHNFIDCIFLKKSNINNNNNNFKTYKAQISI